MQFKKLLTEIHQLQAEKQTEILEQKFQEWKGNQRQIDDILIIGAKI